uniref:Uncharacterized protein n=1 Tax=Tanacetum cinerariifolium TaxID=118510 RepID=A0A6L2MFA0_TANCI|nr:hypothetical protein [Tanacetum cinerariifolium]
MQQLSKDYDELKPETLPILKTGEGISLEIDLQNTTLPYALDLTVHDFDRFKLAVITKAPTLRGLVRPFLLKASAATFAFTR